MRAERAGDADEIDAVHRLAFGQADEADLVRRIRQAEDFDPRLSLVAERSGRIIGHVLFSGIHIETDDGRRAEALALAPMAVLPELQRQGIGSALVRHGLDVCRALGHRIVVVVGRASYYPRFGFRPAGAFGLRCPFEVPDEAFMALELVDGALETTTGLVRYPDAFRLS